MLPSRGQAFKQLLSVGLLPRRNKYLSVVKKEIQGWGRKGTRTSWRLVSGADKSSLHVAATHTGAQSLNLAITI
jgi:hypothetical protein